MSRRRHKAPASLAHRLASAVVGAVVLTAAIAAGIGANALIGPLVPVEATIPDHAPTGTRGDAADALASQLDHYRCWTGDKPAWAPWYPAGAVVTRPGDTAPTYVTGRTLDAALSGTLPAGSHVHGYCAGPAPERTR